MSETPATAAATGWTCPFCPLLCDGFDVDRSARPWRLVGSDCPRALAGLADFGACTPAATPSVDGRPDALDPHEPDRLAEATPLLAAASTRNQAPPSRSPSGSCATVPPLIGTTW